MLPRLFKKANPMHTLRSNRGFTLVEMVITVAVIGILVSMSLPSIYEFMRQREDQNEEIAMQEIRKAIEAYLAAKGTTPDNFYAAATGTDWAKELAGYTNLSKNEIENDVWGRPRMYIQYKNDTRKAFGNNVSVYYITVFSKGANGDAQNTYIDNTGTTQTIPGIPVTDNEYRASTDSTWWRAQTGSASTPETIAAYRVNLFSGLRAGGDDHMMRFTNYAGALDRYNETIKRLDAVTQSLETYARSGYAEKVSECSNNPTPPSECNDGTLEKRVYYPYARAKDNQETPTDVAAIYNSTTLVVDNALTDIDQRRTSMQKLMNNLGLPAEYCCSAMDNAPFYYFSNPRPRTGAGCGARPTFNTTKLPARLITTDSYNSNTCG